MIGRVVMRGRALSGVCVALGWRALAEDCVVPEGEPAIGLVREAVGFLGSTDPV